MRKNLVSYLALALSLTSLAVSGLSFYWNKARVEEIEGKHNTLSLTVNDQGNKILAQDEYLMRVSTTSAEILSIFKQFNSYLKGGK